MSALSSCEPNGSARGVGFYLEEIQGGITMGSFSVLNNMPAVNGINQLNVTNLQLAKTMNRLASGKRINTGADDAAGLQIADALRGNVMALNQAVRNANDGIAFLQVADGALEQVTSLLHRAVTLAEEAATGTMSIENRDALDLEFKFIKSEIDRIAYATNFNGTHLFKSEGEPLADRDSATASLGDPDYWKTANTDPSTGALYLSGTALGGALSVFVGDLTVNDTEANAPSSGPKPGQFAEIKVEIGTIQRDADQVNGKGLDTRALSIATLAGNGSQAASALKTIKSALTAVATMRGTIGAGMNRLQASINVIAAQSQNTLAAESALRDANIAEEISNLTKFQILAQTGIAALGQANANSQNVLALLR